MDCGGWRSSRPTVPPKPDSPPPVHLNPHTGSLPLENLKMEQNFVKTQKLLSVWVFSQIIAPSSQLYQLHIIELVSLRLFLCSSNYIVLACHDMSRRLTTANWAIINISFFIFSRLFSFLSLMLLWGILILNYFCTCPTTFDLF